MFYRKPIFEVLFGNRFVFQQAAPPEGTKPAEEAVPEVAGSADESPEDKEKGKQDVHDGTKQDLEQLSTETRKKAVVDRWAKDGVGESKDAIGDDTAGYEVLPTEVKDHPGEYALYKLVKEKHPNDAPNFIDSNKCFSLSSIRNYFNEDRAYSNYGFYWNGGQWMGYNYGRLDSDKAAGSDFVEAWPLIVNNASENGYNDLSGSKPEVQQEVIRSISQYLCQAGANPSYSGGEIYAHEGIEKAKINRKKNSKKLVEHIRKSNGKWTTLEKCEDWDKSKEDMCSPNDKLYEYRYDKEDDVIVAAGIYGGPKKGKMFVIRGTDGEMDWSMRESVDDASKQKAYYERAYDSADENEQKEYYRMAAPDVIADINPESPEAESYFLEYTGKDTPIDFQFTPLDKVATKSQIEESLKSKIRTRITQDGTAGKWTDAKIATAARLRADDIMTRADNDLRNRLETEYYDYEFMTNHKFEFQYNKSGEVKIKLSGKVLEKLTAYRNGVSDAVSGAEEKVEETLRETIEKAIKASGNENIDPAKVEEYIAEYGSLYGGNKQKAIDGYIKIMGMPFGLGVLVLQFMGPIMKALKGSIGGLVDKAKGKGEKAAEKVAGAVESKDKKESVLTSADVEGCDKGRYVEKDGKREFAKLEQKFTLPAGVYEFDEIHLPEQITVTDEGHFLRKGKRKRIKLAGGVEFPAGTKFKGIKVLAKSNEEASKFIRVASARAASPSGPSESPAEPQVADAASEESAPASPETQVADAAPEGAAPVAPEVAAPDQSETI